MNPVFWTLSSSRRDLSGVERCPSISAMNHSAMGHSATLVEQRDRQRGSAQRSSGHRICAGRRPLGGNGCLICCTYLASSPNKIARPKLSLCLHGYMIECKLAQTHNRSLLAKSLNSGVPQRLWYPSVSTSYSCDTEAEKDRANSQGSQTGWVWWTTL